MREQCPIHQECDKNCADPFTFESDCFAYLDPAVQLLVLDIQFPGLYLNPDRGILDEHE